MFTTRCGRRNKVPRPKGPPLRAGSRHRRLFLNQRFARNFPPRQANCEPIEPVAGAPAAVLIDVAADIDDLEEVIRKARQVPYTPIKEALLIHPTNPREAPAEEFRTLRTRLNHLQTSAAASHARRDQRLSG